MNISDITNDPTVKDLFENRNLKDATRRSYSYNLLHYCKSTETEDKPPLTPTELIEEAESEEDQRIRMRQRTIKKRLQNFKNYLIDHEYVTGVPLTVVRTFYTEFEIELPKTREKRDRNSTETINNLPSIEDVKNILKYCNIKYQAIILLMLSSGMGRGEILSLTVKDFLNAIKDYYKLPKNKPIDIDEIINYLKVKEDQIIIGSWEVNRIKTGMPYNTFSTPESIFAILEYLKTQPPTDINVPLFRNSRNVAIKDDGFTKYFMRLNERCGFGKRGKQNFFKSHVLRAIFASALIKTGFPQLIIDWMLGHSIKNKVTDAYFKPDPKHLKKEYLKVMEAVTIEKVEIRQFESEEVIKIVRELDKEREKRESMEQRMLNQEKQNKAIIGLLKTMYTADVELDKSEEIKQLFQKIK